MKAKFCHKKPENHNVASFYFEPLRALQYTAGQYIEMHLPHNNPDSRGEKRWFTLSSSPGDELISITTKFPDKTSSFKQTLLSLEAGQQVQISDPMGDFVLPKSTALPLVFVAGGIGITPFASMLHWLKQKGEKRYLQILLAAYTPQDFVFDKLFAASGAEVTKIASMAKSDWRGKVGQLSATKILSIIGGAEGKRIYISGPEPMVEFLNKDLAVQGVEKSQLIGDYFPGYAKDLS